LEESLNNWIKTLTGRNDVCFLLEKSVKGEVLTDDILICCHQCAEKLRGGYVVIEKSPCSSRLRFLKHFARALAEKLGCRSDFLDVYEFGIVIIMT